MADKNYARALEVCKKACNENLSSTCWTTGNIYQYGLGISQNYLLARQYYEKSCLLGNHNGCLALAYIYIKGDGIQSDDHLAAIFGEHSCKLGNGEGCYFTALVYATKKHLTNNDPKLLDSMRSKYLKEACDLQYEDACEMLKQ